MTTQKRQLMARAAAFAGQMYCRHAPTSRGKFFVWKKLFRDYLEDSGLVIETRSSFGARYQLNLGDWVQRSIYAFGEWEPVITSYLLAHLKPGDVFIDIG